MTPPPGPPDLSAQLAAYQRRIRRDRRGQYLAWAALAVAGYWLLVAGLYYLDRPFPQWLPVGLAWTVLLPLAALLVEWWDRPTPVEIAAMLDARLDNRQRVLTAVELLAAGAPAPLAATQLTTTAALLESAPADAVYPVRSPWPVAGFSAGLLALALGLLILKGVPDSFAPFQAGSGPDTPQSAAAAHSPPPPDGLPGATPPTPPPAAAGGATPSAGNAAGDPGGTSGSATDPNAAMQQAAASNAAQEALQRLAQALGEQSATQQAGDNLRQGNTEQAAQQLEELGQQNDQLSPDAKQGLGDALQRAASDPATTPPDLRQAEQDAADALHSGDYKSIADSLKNLADAARQTADQVVPQQELAKQFPAPPTPGAGTSPDAQATAEAAQQGQGDQQPSQGDQQGQGDQPSQGDQQGQGQSQQQGDQQGQGQGDQQAQGDQPSQGDQQGPNGAGGAGSGQGTRVFGPPDEQQLNVGDNPFELEGRPDSGPTQPGDNSDPQGPGAGESAGIGAPQPVRPGSAVTAQGETTRPPVSRWELVQRYFSPDN
jgi:hypothetical protein